MMAETGAEAVANARRFNNYQPGYCLKFVRAEAWQIGGLYGSAIDAWYGARHRHPGDRNPPVGAPMFYAGGQYGHIVIRTDPNQIRSTDCEDTGEVSDSYTDWPVDNWGQTYLGWTEDLNGVALPLAETEEEEMTEDDWKKLRGIVREEVHAEMEKQRPEYTKSVMYWDVQEDDPETNVRQALRLSANHAREHNH